MWSGTHWSMKIFWYNSTLYTSLAADTIWLWLNWTINLNRLLLATSTDKHYLLESEDGFCSGCWNINYQQQFFLELPSSGENLYLIISVHYAWFLKQTFVLVISFYYFMLVFVFLAVDSRRTSSSDGSLQWRIHPVEWIDI